jgi:hypothetical protein
MFIHLDKARTRAVLGMAVLGLAVTACSHAAPGAPDIGAGGGTEVAQTAGPAGDPVGSQAGNAAGGGTANASAGGGHLGAPISIPPIVLEQGVNVLTIKEMIDYYAIPQCGPSCLNIVIVDTSRTQCLSTFSISPPPAPVPDGANLSIRQGATITLHGGQDNSGGCAYEPFSPPDSPSAPAADSALPDEGSTPPTTDPASPEAPAQSPPDSPSP